MKTRYELEFPIQVGSQEITALDIARPNAGLMKTFDLSKWDVAMSVAMVAKLASVPNSDLPITIKVIDMLDFSDLTKIGELVVSWFPKPRGD